MRDGLPDHFGKDIERIKQETPLPIAAGFGISSRQSAKEAISSADGFVVGSFFVDAMGRGVAPEEITQLAKQIDPRRGL